MRFDHPQWEMYSTSKHEVRALLKQVGVTLFEMHLKHRMRTFQGAFHARH